MSFETLITNVNSSLLMVWDENGYLTYVPNNLIVSSAVMSTLTIGGLITGVYYILSFTGTGTMSKTMGGNLVGKGTDVRVLQKFQATSASTYVTVTGDVRKCQLEAVTYQTLPSDYVETTGTKYIGPAYEYDIVTGTPLGLRIEPQRTSFGSSPCDLTSGAWTLTGITPGRAKPGPDGMVGGCTTLTATAAGGTALQSITLTSRSQIASCYVKGTTATGTMQLTLDGTTWYTVPVSNTWTRVSTPAVTLTNANTGIKLLTAGDSVDVGYFQHEGNTQVSGPQFSVGFRSADVYTVNLSNWFSQGQGVLYYELVPYVLGSTTNWIVSLNDGTVNNRIDVKVVATNQLQLLVYNNNVAVVSTTVTSKYVQGALAKIAVSFTDNYVIFTLNGQVIGSIDTSAIIPTNLTKMYLSSYVSGTGTSCYLRNVKYYPHTFDTTDKLLALTA